VLIKHSAAGFEMDLPGWLERCGNVHGDVAEQNRTGQDRRTSENCTSRQGIQMVIATEQADTTHTALSGGIRQNTTSDAQMLMFFSRHAPARRVASGLGISSSRVPVEFKACFGLLTGLGISSSRVPVEFKACFGLLNVQSFAEFEEAS
jgi:hypothetical protein